MPNGIRMDYLDDELLALLKEAGLYLVSIAVESGNNEILQDMKKGTKIQKIHRDVNRIKKHDFDIAAFFILGYPGETMETINDTIALSLKLPLLRANYFTYLPLPGTESYHKLEETGEIKNIDWDNFYIMGAPYTPKGISREDLLEIKRKAFLKFYMRPRILIRNILGVKSFGHFKFLFKRFCNWIIVNNHVALEIKQVDIATEDHVASEIKSPDEKVAQFGVGTLGQLSEIIKGKEEKNESRATLTDLNVKVSGSNGHATKPVEIIPVRGSGNGGGQAVAARKLISTVAIAKLKGYEGDPCTDCGQLTLVRNGTCLKCQTCGATSS